MLLPLYVLCSKFFLNQNILFILKSGEILRPVFTVQALVEDMSVCGVLSSSHRSTPHTTGAKRFNLGSLCPHVCGLSHFKILLDLNNLLACTQHRSLLFDSPASDSDN